MSDEEKPTTESGFRWRKVDDEDQIYNKNPLEDDGLEESQERWKRSAAFHHKPKDPEYGKIVII